MPKPILTARCYAAGSISPWSASNTWTSSRTCANSSNEVSSFADEACAGAGSGAAAGVEPPIGEVFEIAGSGSQIRMDAADLHGASGSHADPSVAMSGQVGSQVKMMVGNSWLIANVRTLRAGDDGELVAHVDFLGEGSQRFVRQAQQLPPRRHPLPDPRLRRASGHDRGPARHLRRQRRAAYRDRHRLSDRRHPRRALRRPDAVEAFRGPGIDRYR